MTAADAPAEVGDPVERGPRRCALGAGSSRRVRVPWVEPTRPRRRTPPRASPPNGGTMNDRDPDDRDDIMPPELGEAGDDTPLSETSAEMMNPPVHPEAMPEQGPNTDDGFDANPPSDVDMPRTSDDNDLNVAGSGVSETHIRPTYERIALRDDLARRLEDLVGSAREWADEVRTAEAQELAEELADLYERLGEPLEETDETIGNV
jgi:hypothetical protein